MHKYRRIGAFPAIGLTEHMARATPLCLQDRLQFRPNTAIPSIPTVLAGRVARARPVDDVSAQCLHN